MSDTLALPSIGGSLQLSRVYAKVALPPTDTLRPCAGGKGESR